MAKKSSSSKKSVKINRDAGSGKFVSKKFASTHPKTTVAQTVRKSGKK